MKAFWQKKSTAIILAVFCCSLWGSAAPCIKQGYEILQIAANDTYSILLFAGIRFFLAGCMVLLFWKASQKQPLKHIGSIWKPVCVLALFQTAGQYFFYYLGIAGISRVSSALLTGTGAFFTLLAAVYIFHYEKMQFLKAIGCLMGFLGICLMNLSSFQNGSFSFSLRYDGFVLLSQICAALSSGYIKQFSRKYDPVFLSGAQFMLGGFVLAAAGFAFGGRIASFSWAGAGILVYLAFVSAAAYTIWSILLKYHPLSFIGMFNCLIPAAGVLWSAFLLSETSQAFSWTTWLSLSLIVLGIAFVNKTQPAGRQKS